MEVVLPKMQFATWFKGTSLELDGDLAYVFVANSFCRDWISSKYKAEILKSITKISPDVKRLEFKIKTQKPIDRLALEVKPKSAPKEQSDSLFATGFKEDYTFDKFVVGNNNSLAYAVAQEVGSNPGKRHNPLFIYGGVGLGKTHLAQAVGHEVKRQNKNAKVVYVSCETFTNDFINAIASKKMAEFKRNYRNVDVLIVDDIQFLSSKEGSQEEFFHTFNALYEKNKQIVISSDRPPNAISSLEERLCSRFEGGMITDISLPDFETRIAILKTKAQEKRINIASDVLEYIALNIKRNIRELEGALNQVAVYQKVNNCDVDVEKIKVLLKNVISSPYKKITSKKIIKCVADFYDLKESEVLQFSRKKEIVRPRQIAMFFLRRELKSSFPFIGRRFAGRDHTTAIYAYEKISKEIEMDNKFKEEIDLIKQLISKN